MPCDMTGAMPPGVAALRTAVNTQHDRQRRTVNIRIQYADSAAFLRQRQSDISGGGGFADPPFADATAIMFLTPGNFSTPPCVVWG